MTARQTIIANIIGDYIEQHDDIDEEQHTENTVCKHYKNKINYTSLIHLCQNEMSFHVMQLLSLIPSNPSICNINEQDEAGNTPLMICCINNMVQVALKLLELKCDTSITNVNNETALMIACDSRQTNIALKILQTPNPNINQIDIHNCSALFNACLYNMSLVAKRIIQNPADSNINFRTQYNGSVLLSACYNRMYGVVDDLIKLDNDVGYCDKDNNTALIICCKKNMIKQCKILLLTKKANPYVLNNDNDDFISLAYQNKHYDLIKLAFELYSEEIDMKELFRHIGYKQINSNYRMIKWLFNYVLHKYSKNKQIEFLLSFVDLHRDKKTIKSFIGQMIYSLKAGKILSEFAQDNVKKIEAINTYVDTLSNKLELKDEKHRCTICCNKNFDYYLFDNCNHVLSIDLECLNKLTKCPFCRTDKTIVKKVFIN